MSVLPFCMEKGFSVTQYGWPMSIFTAASLVCVVLLGVVKLKPRIRFWVMSLGFCGSVVCFAAAYFSGRFVPLCIMAAAASFLNCAGNTIFNASMMVALPEENQGAILGFFRSASIGGTALSALIYGFLGEIFPLHLVFAAGSALSLLPMVHLCFPPPIQKIRTGALIPTPPDAAAGRIRGHLICWRASSFLKWKDFWKFRSDFGRIRR